MNGLAQGRLGVAGGRLAFALAGLLAGGVAMMAWRALPRGRRAAGLDAAAPSGLHAPPDAAAHEHGRGRSAADPTQIPRRGWSDILRRTAREIADDHILLVAAGVTFYAMLAFFPGLAAVVALYGLVGDVAEAPAHLAALTVFLPTDVVRFIGGEMVRLSQARSGGLSVAFGAGLALSVWGANGAVKAVFLGLNIAYEEEEKRGFLRLTLTTLVFTVVALALLAAMLAAALAVQAAAAFVGPAAEATARLARWPALALFVSAGVALVYRYGPSRDRAKWRWVTWGAGAATLVWILASAGFSLYLERFAHYDRTYGPLGAVFGFMVWTYISSLIILAGAELNAEMEHQTARDTTTGAERPLGLRGARMADTIGAAQTH